MPFVDGEKRCPKCGSAGPFFRDARRKGGLSVWCKVCQKAATEAVRKRDLAKHAGYTRAYWEAHPDKLRNTKLKKYGLTVESFDALFLEQGGLCACCGDVLQIERKNAVAVDHCHKTGRVRGIVCRPCNLGLGFFQDSPGRLQSAIAYLARGNT